MRRLGGIAAIALLTACGGGTVQETVEDVSRTAAKAVINTAVERQFPQLNASMVTDCIIDNATLSEVATISLDVATSPKPETIALVSEIANRPGTVACFTEKGTALLVK